MRAHLPCTNVKRVLNWHRVSDAVQNGRGSLSANVTLCTGTYYRAWSEFRQKEPVMRAHLPYTNVKRVLNWHRVSDAVQNGRGSLSSNVTQCTRTYYRAWSEFR